MAYQINSDKCSGCGECYQVCMNGAIVDLLDYFQINPAWCIECGACAVMCYENAITYNKIENVKPDDCLKFKDLEYFPLSEILWID